MNIDGSHNGEEAAFAASSFRSTAKPLLTESSLNIALIARHSFGDLLLALPLINMLKAYYENSNINLIVDHRIRSIVDYIPNIDCFFVLPKAHNVYLSYLMSINGLRSLNTNFAIAAKAGSGNQNGIVSFLTRAPARLAYVDRRRRGWADSLLSIPVDIDRNIIGAIHYSSAVAGLVFPYYLTQQCLPEEFWPRLKRDTLNSSREGIEGFAVMVVLGDDSDPRKPSDSFLAQYINELSSVIDLTAFISFLPGQEGRAQQLQSKIEVISNLAITPTIPDLLSFINVMDLVVGGDGGTIHMAAALDRPILSAMSAETYTQWRPLARAGSVFTFDKFFTEISIALFVEASLGLLKVGKSLR